LEEVRILKAYRRKKSKQVKESHNIITQEVDHSLPQSPDFITIQMTTPDIPPLSHCPAIAKSTPGHKRDEKTESKKKILERNASPTFKY